MGNEAIFFVVGVGFYLGDRTGRDGGDFLFPNRGLGCIDGEAAAVGGGDGRLGGVAAGGRDGLAASLLDDVGLGEIAVSSGDAFCIGSEGELATIPLLSQESAGATGK